MDAGTSRVGCGTRVADTTTGSSCASSAPGASSAHTAVQIFLIPLLRLLSSTRLPWNASTWKPARVLDQDRRRRVGQLRCVSGHGADVGLQDRSDPVE